MSINDCKLVHGRIDMKYWFHSKSATDACNNALRAAFAEQPPYLYFPIEWDFGPENERGDGYDGKPPDDPAMLYVCLPLTGDDNMLVYAVSLETVVDGLIDGHTNPVTGNVEEEEPRAILGKVAARLRDLAEKLYDACNAENKDAS